MNAMSKKMESWIHTKEVTDIAAIEKPIEPDVAQAVFDLDRCIECGICLAACSTRVMREDFVVPWGSIEHYVLLLTHMMKEQMMSFMGSSVS